jgi:methyl-accepting chemotaxis protein
MTSTLIETTASRVRQGTSLVGKTSEAFAELNRNAEKVSGLVAEIAAASQEQTRGIDQVSSAITEMDKVVQQTAANAEESASASEELNAQASQMQAVAETLLQIVNGSSNGTTSREAASSEPMPRKSPLSVSAKLGSMVGLGNRKKAEKITSLDDGNFKDF